MSSPGFEALVKLTPLDASNELQRVFTLNTFTDRINVGRASKNESKGLVAAKENAWFDSPIMSRQHARFTISIAHRGVCLQDNGSTHGTSVGGRRLQPQIDYALSNGEIITFGVRVTSGELSYPAREFRFNFEWRLWSPESPVFKTTQNNSECIRFHVPDEEKDCISEESRENSVQVLDSHVRGFSVPSSDDDLESEEDDIDDEDIPPSTPQHDDVEKPPFTPSTPQHLTFPNLGTTPEHPIEVWTEPSPAEDLELVSPSKARCFSRLSKFGRAGTSVANPIDVEAKSTDRRIVTGSDGEDEAPSIYSPKVDVYSPRPDVYSPRPDVYSPRPDVYSPRLESYSPYSPTLEQPDVDQGKSLSAEQPNPFHKSFNSPLSSNALRIVEQSKEHQRAITHEDESGDEADALRRKAHSLAGSVRASLQAKSTSNSPDEFDDADEDDFDNNACFLMSPVVYPERSMGSETSALNPSASKHVHFNLGDNAPCANALTNVASRTNWSDRISPSGMMDVNPDTQIEAHRTTQRPPSPSDAALAKNTTNSALRDHWPFIRDGQSLPRDHDNPYLKETNQKTGTPWMENFTGSARHIRDGSFFDVPDPVWPRYKDGPFTSHTQHNTLPALPSSYSFRQNQNSVSLDQTTRKINSLASHLSMVSAGEEGRVTKSPSPPSTHQKTSISVSEESECRHKGNECHPARLNISDIVNPLAETTRNLKRKADKMSSNAVEEHEMEQAAESSQQALPLETGGRELYFNDAQHRDNLIDVETNLFQSSSIDLTTASLQNKADLMGLGDAGPARKKQKTSSSSAVSIGKFVSGVLVGVAGAIAAFIVTIPMSVQEEALREIAPAL